MIGITFNGVQYGPFQTVETLEDRFLADNVFYPFTVVGKGTVAEWTGPLPTPSIVEIAE